MAIGTPVSLGSNSVVAAGTTVTRTLAAGVALGNKVFVFVGTDTSGKTCTVADNRSGSNVYTVDRTQNATQPSGAYIASCELAVALQSGDIITATLSGSTADRGIAVASCSGIAVSTPLDQTTGTQGTATGWSSGATSATTQADELVWGMVADNDSAATTGVGSAPGGGYTELFDFGNTDGLFLVVQYLIVASTGAQTGSGTFSGGAPNPTSPRWQALVATYKGAAAASFVPRAEARYMQAVNRGASY